MRSKICNSYKFSRLNLHLNLLPTIQETEELSEVDADDIQCDTGCSVEMLDDDDTITIISTIRHNVDDDDEDTINLADLRDEYNSED